MRPAMRIPVTCVLLATFGTVLAAAPKVRVDAIEGALPACKTFSWNPTPTADATSLTDQRVRDAVMQKLQAKGYTEVTDNADCRIAYQLTVQETEAAKPRVGVGVGGGSGGMGGGIGVSLPIGKKKKAQGTFTLDVIDSAKNAQVWSGALDAAFDSTEISDKEAKAAVEKILAKYPDRQ